MPRSDDRMRANLEAMCRELGGALRAECPPGVGFMLSVFDFGDRGWSTYASNGQRADMVKFLRELADHLERGAVQ